MIFKPINCVCERIYINIYFKINIDGPSATNDVCPRGDIFGSLTNSDSNWNVGHSCRRFGLRIYQYAQRTYPCKTIINPTATGADYWSSNPTI